MSEYTKIEWADHSWSPWRGCTKVSEGCAHCYAETLSKLNPAVLGEWGKGKPRVLAKNWRDPVKWNKNEYVCQDCGKWDSGVSGDCACGQYGAGGKVRRQRVFPSLCDWLDDEVSSGWLARFLALIELTPNLDWLLLTKRPQLWRDRIVAAAMASTEYHRRWLLKWLQGTPPPNVWFGVSVENQARADERIPELLRIPAMVRWLSVEPLLGPVSLAEAALSGGDHVKPPAKIDWVVIGGESGKGARSCDVEWIRSLAMQCKPASVPVFVKQLGARPYQSWSHGPVHQTTPPEIAETIGEAWTLEHRKGGDPSEWTTDLRIRQFPAIPPA